MHQMLPLTMALGLSAAGCALYFEGEDPPDVPAPPDTDCTLYAASAEAPGYPFDVVRFREQVWPALEESCAYAGCHAPGNPFYFTVWPNDGSDCSMVQSFNEVYVNTSFSGEGYDSKVIANIDGTLPIHPVRFESGAYPLDLITDYVQQAVQRYDRDISDPPPPDFYFDADIFAQAIQPMLDDAQCAVSGCHANEPHSSFGLYLNANPALGSAAMDQNRRQVASYIDLTLGLPWDTRFYQRATDRHAGVAVSDPDVLERWIALAIEAARPAPLQLR